MVPPKTALLPPRKAWSNSPITLNDDEVIEPSPAKTIEAVNDSEALLIGIVGKVIAHPGWVSALLGEMANAWRRSLSTERLLAFAVLTTERKAA